MQRAVGDVLGIVHAKVVGCHDCNANWRCNAAPLFLSKKWGQLRWHACSSGLLHDKFTALKCLTPHNRSLKCFGCQDEVFS